MGNQYPPITLRNETRICWLFEVIETGCVATLDTYWVESIGWGSPNYPGKDLLGNTVQKP